MRHLPAGSLQNFEEALNSEIVKERGMVQTVEHPLTDQAIRLAQFFGYPGARIRSRLAWCAHG